MAPDSTEAQQLPPELTGDRYQIERRLGAGGMATVYRACDEELKRPVAVKVLHRHLLSNPDHIRRFRREAEAVARLDHPHLLQIYDLLEIRADYLALVMEYVEATSLDELLERRAPLLPELASAIAAPLFDAVAHAHDAGIIHRDIKPANILIGDDGTPYLSDFGLAHVADADSLTDAGEILGSPAYISPEIIEGTAVDPRADIFSMGSVLFAMVTAEKPFSASNPASTMRNVVEGRRSRADELCESVGRRFGNIVEDFLASDRNDRPRNARQAAEITRDFARSTTDLDPDLLKRWIDDPSGVTSGLTSEISGALRRRALRSMESGDDAQALLVLERLLAIRPDDPEAHELLDRLHESDGEPPKSDSLRGVPTAAAIAAVGLAVVAAVVLAIVDIDRESAEPAAERTETDPPVVDETEQTSHEGALEALKVDAAPELARHVESTARSTADDAVRPPASETSPTESTGTEHSPDPPPADDHPSPQEDTGEPATGELRLQVLPLSASLEIAEREFDAVDAAGGIELPTGTHELVARAPASIPERKTVEIGDGTTVEHSIVLEWKEGYIRVVADRDALLWIDGRDSPRRLDAGQTERVAVSFGSADQSEPARQITLRAAPRDDLENTRRETVSARPGKEIPVAFSLNGR